jgi:hypothetical protein
MVAVSFIDVDLTGPGIRPLTYQTHGEHTYYNTTEVVEAVIKQGYNQPMYLPRWIPKDTGVF